MSDRGRASGTSTRGRGTADSKRMERERRIRHQKRVFRLRVAGVLFVLAAIVTGMVALYRSSVFEIHNVEVVGTERLPEDEVRALTGLPDGSTLLRFSRADMIERLRLHPWILEAHVSRDFPDGVRVRIEERKPAVLVDAGDALFWLVDAEGVALEQRAPETTSTLVVVRDLADFEPVAGERVDSESLMNALAVLEGLSEELRLQVRAISAPSVDVTTLITKGDVEILVGSAEEIAKKDMVARRILEEQGEHAVFVNVRTVDRPTWRGVDPVP